MPYITKNHREKLIPHIDALAKAMKEITEEFPEQTRDGLLNFSTTEIINQLFPNARYTDMNEIIGFLECCKLEYYRKVAAPYEDKKEAENGPVRTFNTGGPKSY